MDKLKSREEIEDLIKQCEGYILCDIDYPDLKRFNFYGEVNTGLLTIEGLRKVLLWVLNKQPRNCHIIGER